MRVALDGLLLGGVHSGVERSIEQLAAALPRVAPQNEYLLVCRPRYADKVPPGITPLPVPGWADTKFGRIIYTQTTLARRLTGMADIVHAPGYVMPLNWRGPSVLTVYDLIALDYPAWCTRANVCHYRLTLPRSIARADRVIVPNRTVARAVERHYGEMGERMRVIPLGIEARYAPAGEEQMQNVRAAQSLPEEFVLCVGNLEPKKNLAAVVRAFGQVAERVPHHLVIAGGKSWRMGELNQALDESPVRQRIHSIGFVPDERLPALYSAAAVLVQWSLYEGVGLVPVEAMACGTPVITSDGGALPETVGDAALVVPLGPPERLAHALIDVLQRPEPAAELRRRGLVHAAGYSWDRHAAAVSALYEEIIHAGI